MLAAVRKGEEQMKRRCREIEATEKVRHLYRSSREIAKISLTAYTCLVVSRDLGVLGERGSMAWRRGRLQAFSLFRRSSERAEYTKIFSRK